MTWSALRTMTLLAGGAVLAVSAWPTSATAAIKKLAYPEVKIEIAPPHQPDAAFQAFWKAFGDAVAAKNTAALMALVGPTFVWTSQGGMVDEFDPGRDAQHNFKVVFGFRAAGKDQDGGVEGGPYWDVLALLAADATFHSASESTSLICGPMVAAAANATTLEQAQKKLQIGDDSGTWYFTPADTSVARAPGDTGAPVGKLGKAAFPVLSVHPAPREGAPDVAPTHLEVLLPSGRSGWIGINAARPLVSDRLCYAKTAAGEWRIVNFDEAE